MKLNEFKAWLEGFTDAMGDAPTPEQWKKIRAKLNTVTESGMDLPKFVQQPLPDRRYLDERLQVFGPEIRFIDLPPNGHGQVICGDPPGSIQRGGTA